MSIDENTNRLSRVNQEVVLIKGSKIKRQKRRKDLCNHPSWGKALVKSQERIIRIEDGGNCILHLTSL